MASTLFGLSRAVAARSAAIPRSVVRACPALHAQAPAFVAGVRFYRGEELDRRMRTLLIHNVPWEMTLEEVQQELQPFRGFVSVEPIEDKDGSFRILFTDKSAKTHARGVFRKISWQGRGIIPVSEHTDEEPPKPSRSLYIAGIPRNVADEELNRLFAGVEGHQRIKVPKSKQWDGYVGFATVLFGSVEQATKAMELLNERWVDGSKVWVNYSRLPPPREKRARNAYRVRNPKLMDEDVVVGPSEKQLTNKERAAAARARRKAREEGVAVTHGVGESASVKKEVDETGDKTENKPGVMAEFMGVAQAKGDELATSAKNGPNDRADEEAVASATKNESTDKPSETGGTASDALAAEASDETRDEASETSAAEALDEVSDRIAAARARRQAKEEAEAGEMVGEVTDKPSETEPAKEETAAAKDRSS